MTHTADTRDHWLFKCRPNPLYWRVTRSSLEYRPHNT